MRLAEFIQRNAEPILARWESFAREIWPQPGVDPAALRDHAAEILRASARDCRFFVWTPRGLHVILWGRRARRGPAVPTSSIPGKGNSMAPTRFALAACVLAAAASPAPAAAAAVTATTLFRYANGSFNTTSEGSAVDPGTLFPGATTASAAGSSLDQSFANASSGFAVSAAVVQDYAVFHARASAQGMRTSPDGDFEVFQVFADGTFTETLTIPAPAGVTPGTPAHLSLGWDVTGTTSPGAAGDARFAIFAHTSASLPNTSSNTVAIRGNGHFDLVSPISFLWGVPFDVTVESDLFAAVGYDYRTTPAPGPFADTASADFFHTSVLSTAVVTDADGNAYPDATLVTASGHAFPVAVPEPAAVALTLAPALIARRPRRR